MSSVVSKLWCSKLAPRLLETNRGTRWGSHECYEHGSLGCHGDGGRRFGVEKGAVENGDKRFEKELKIVTLFWKTCEREVLNVCETNEMKNSKHCKIEERKKRSFKF